jgi:hypothetical protein
MVLTLIRTTKPAAVGAVFRASNARLSVQVCIPILVKKNKKCYTRCTSSVGSRDKSRVLDLATASDSGIRVKFSNFTILNRRSCVNDEEQANVHMSCW